ncbi:MAG: exodeoxyribonuclease V subunit alpha [Pseudomonadales bacterium]|nr:exodeoxyribonuclease V subunit alpha [Pseudomonadales bacterium]
MKPHTELLTQLDHLADEGYLRRLGSAFARFIASLDQATPALLIASCVLSELEGRGHSCLQLTALTAEPWALLGWDAQNWQIVDQIAGSLPKTTAEWRTALANCTQVWLSTEPDSQQPLVLDQDRLYLRRYWRNETQVAETVRFRAAHPRSLDVAQIRKWLDKLFDSPPEAGTHWQKIACAVSVRSHFSIITGGPGTGKTYTVARLLALLLAIDDDPARLRVAMAAPTGKAAARLTQSIDTALAELAKKVGDALPLAQLTARLGAARTLHSLLGARPNSRAFRHHSGNPLAVDVLIVDEASMVHLEMMAALLDTLPAHAMVVLLGDKDQLASVEAGAVLGDLCSDAQTGGYTENSADYIVKSSGESIPSEFLGQQNELAQQTVMLRHSHRFSGPIAVLALAINSGSSMDAMECLRAEEGNLLAWLTQTTTAATLDLALNGRPGAEGGYADYLRILPEYHPAASDTLVHENWVRKVLRAFEGIRVLCAVREGEWGVTGLNLAIERRLEAEGWIKRRGEWYVGRPVMVTRNDYGTGVFNGDIGIALPDAARPDVLRVYFLEGDAVRGVLTTRLRDVETAYAMTVHKSQGSEFQHTVLVLPPQSSPVLTRELVYTGVTRARKYFTLVTPDPSVLASSIESPTRRESGLYARL